jgi:hypothetical protein
MKILIPVPEIADATATTIGLLSRVIVEYKYIDTIARIIPNVEGILVPIRSAILPLMGPNTDIETAAGSKYRAASAVVIRNPDTRKNGIRKNVAELAQKHKNLAIAPKENGTELNRERGSIGSGHRFSQRRNPANTITERKKPPYITGDCHPRSLAKVIATITKRRNTADNMVPPQSSCLKLRLSVPLSLSSSCSTIVAISADSRLNAAINTNIARHSKRLSIPPPTTGPPTAPIPTTVICSPAALPLSLSGNALAIIAIPFAWATDAPTPIRIFPESTMPKLPENEVTSEAAAKSTNPHIHT